MRFLVRLPSPVALMLVAGSGLGCSKSSAAMSLPDAQACIDCVESDAPFDAGIGPLYCEEIDDAGFPICGEMPSEAAAIMCQSQNGRLASACPSDSIGACKGFQGGDSQPWFGNVDYYSPGDAGRAAGDSGVRAKDASSAGAEGGAIGADASPTVDSGAARARADCKANKGVWLPAM